MDASWPGSWRGGREDFYGLLSKACPDDCESELDELAEALEGHRKGLHDPHLPKRDNYTVEIADALIRLFDLAGGTCIDLPGAFEEKMQYNARRADHKIENRRLPGGKKV